MPTRRGAAADRPLLLLDRLGGRPTAPASDYTYTNNWPPDRTVGNVASTETFIWSLGGILSLFVVLGLFVFFVHRYEFFYGEAKGGRRWPRS